MSKMYLIEGIYHTIEDSTTKSLWVFEKKSDSIYYENKLEEAMILAEERYRQYCIKHDYIEEEEDVETYQLCNYLDRIIKVFLKKDREQYFYLEAFLGLGYYEYVPSFFIKEIKFIKGSC